MSSESSPPPEPPHSPHAVQNELARQATTEKVAITLDAHSHSGTDSNSEEDSDQEREEADSDTGTETDQSRSVQVDSRTHRSTRDRVFGAMPTAAAEEDALDREAEEVCLWPRAWIAPGRADFRAHLFRSHTHRRVCAFIRVRSPR